MYELLLHFLFPTISTSPIPMTLQMPTPLPVSVQNFPAPAFWDIPLYQNAVAGLAVFLVGIPSGLWIDRVTIGWASKRKEQDYLKALHNAVNTNLQKLVTIKENKGKLTYLRLDLGMFDASALQKYETISDYQLASEIEEVHATLRSVQDRLDAWQTLSQSAFLSQHLPLMCHAEKMGVDIVDANVPEAETVLVLLLEKLHKRIKWKKGEEAAMPEIIRVTAPPVANNEQAEKSSAEANSSSEQRL